MSETGTLAPLLSALRDLMEWLRAGHVQGMVIGGVAASIQGRPRVTRDVDVLVLLDRPDWEEFLAAGSNFGFAARISDPLDFAQRTRVLLSHHEPSGIDIDIAFGVLPFEKEAIKQAQWVDIGGVSVPLPTPEDLIIMKAVANRPRDRADIESVLDAHPQLNIQRVRRIVSEFSDAAEAPEIIDDFEAILAKRQK